MSCGTRRALWASGCGSSLQVSAARSSQAPGPLKGQRSGPSDLLTPPPPSCSLRPGRHGRHQGQGPGEEHLLWRLLPGRCGGPGLPSQGLLQVRRQGWCWGAAAASRATGLHWCSFSLQMKIHSPSPHKQVSSKCNDYFFNYFTLGLVGTFTGLRGPPQTRRDVSPSFCLCPTGRPL